MNKNMDTDYFKSLDNEKKIEVYADIRKYFFKYMLMYMKENHNIEDIKQIDHWDISKYWLVVHYYDEYMDNDEEIDLPIADFFEYIKSKENPIK